MSVVEILQAGRRNIVVLGAGFGGITAILKLRALLSRERLLPAYHLVLVNRGAYHLYTPALYEIAALPRQAAPAQALQSAVCIPIPDILARYPEIRFIREEVMALNPATHLITLASGKGISFEYAVAALGAETNFFDIPGLADHAYPLKTFEDAVRIRNRAEALARAGGPLRVIVGGGGATGVELAAEFACFFRRLANDSARPLILAITILEAGEYILPAFSQRIRRRAERRLTRLGVRMETRVSISRVTPAEVVLADGRGVRYHLLVWSGGVRPPPTLANFGLRLDRRGAVMVNDFLEARPRIYAIGDNAGFTHRKTGRPLPGNVPVAEAEARLAARNIVAAITGRRQRPYRPMAAYPFILAVGGKYALTDLIIVRLSGLAGWAAKHLIELRYLLFILPWTKAIRMWFRSVRYGMTND